MNTSSLTDSIVTLDLLDLSGAGAINLTAMNMDGGYIHLTVESRPELFIQLNCEKNARRDHNDSLRGSRSSETTLHILDHHKCLATASGDGDTTNASSQQSVKSTLLVWAKGQSQRASCVDVIIIRHEKGGVQPPCDSYLIVLGQVIKLFNMSKD